MYDICVHAREGSPVYQWYFGNTIEPSVHYGTIYLDLTKQLAAE